MPVRKMRNYWSVPLVSDKQRKKIGIRKYRIHDVGRPGHTQRLAGLTKKGSWMTLGWRFAKSDVKVVNGYLIGNTPKTKETLSRIPKRKRKVPKKYR